MMSLQQKSERGHWHQGAGARTDVQTGMVDEDNRELGEDEFHENARC